MFSRFVLKQFVNGPLCAVQIDKDNAPPLPNPRINHGYSPLSSNMGIPYTVHHKERHEVIKQIEFGSIVKNNENIFRF